MTAEYSIVPAEKAHIGPLSMAVSALERDTAEALGRNPRHMIRDLFNASCYRRTAIVAERPVAMWGLLGTLAESDGEVWLVMGDTARARPYAIVREAVKELRGMLASKRTVRSSLLCRDARAQRFASWLGFRTIGRAESPVEHFIAILEAD